MSKEIRPQEEFPANVVDFVKELSALTKDTGVEVKSFDWSEAMLEDEAGELYFVEWKLGSTEYGLRKAVLK